MKLLVWPASPGLNGALDVDRKPSSRCGRPCEGRDFAVVGAFLATLGALTAAGGCFGLLLELAAPGGHNKPWRVERNKGICPAQHLGETD